MSKSYADEDLERCTLTGSREILFQLRSPVSYTHLYDLMCRITETPLSAGQPLLLQAIANLA